MITIGSIVSVKDLSAAPRMAVVKFLIVDDSVSSVELIWWDFKLQEHRTTLPVALLDG